MTYVFWVIQLDLMAIFYGHVLYYAPVFGHDHGKLPETVDDSPIEYDRFPWLC